MSAQPSSSSSSSSTSSTTTSSSVSTTQATVLTTAQATQLLQKLKTLNSSGVAGEQQTIKIQAVQTNPSTGVRQIIAIPIQTAAAAAAGGGSGGGATAHVVSSAALGAAAGIQGKISVSPLKIRQAGAGGAAVGGGLHGVVPPMLSGTTSSLGPNVKVVKLAAVSAVDAARAGEQVATTLQISNPTQVHTPSKAPGQLNFGTPTFIDPLGSSGRKRSDIDFDSFSESKRRKSEKGGKGLRHFSMKVCEKVQAKGSTSYNEVADELVAELTDPRCTSPTDQQYDQKNIRRRVYDALNVLMAMNIISKEKKEIRWLGLPTNSVQEANSLELDKEKRMERIKAKTQQLQDLILQQIAFKNLVERNKEREKIEGTPPAPNSAIQLPFIIVNTSKKTVIDCSISNDKMEYLFNFDDTFEIHDDMEVLKRMGLGFGLEHGQVSEEDLAKAKQMVPRALEQYVTQLAQGDRKGSSDMPKVSPPKISALMAQGASFSQEESDSEVDIS